MTRKVTLIALLIPAVAVAVVAQDARRAGVTLQAAMAAEFIEADVPKAITLYERAVAEAGENRPLTAQSLLALGLALEKGGRLADARAAYGRILQAYSERPEAVEARERLVTTQDALPSRVIDEAFAGNSMSIQHMELSPDGTAAAYGRVAGNSQRMTSSIVMRDLSSGIEQVIAEGLDGRVAGLRFSPDGQRVAATLQARNPEYHETLAVARVSAAGAPIIVPTLSSAASVLARPYHAFWPAWSPDSRMVPYLVGRDTDSDVELRVLDVVSGLSKSLGRHSQPDRPEGALPLMPDFQWSPNSERLARRVVVESGPDELHVVSIESGEALRMNLPVGFDRLHLAGWTERDEIVLHRSRVDAPLMTHVALLSPNSGQLKDVCAGAVPDRPRRVFYGESGGGDACLGLSTDGSRLLRWDSETSQLFVRDVATESDRKLTLGSGEEHMGFLSPDGQGVVFVSNRDGRWGLYAARVDTTPTATPTRLTELEGLPTLLVLAWKGEGFAVTIRYSTTNLWRVDVNPLTGRTTGPPYRLTQDSIGNIGPSISPDGRHVAYLSMRRAQWSLAIMNADGSNERALPTPMMAAAPAWLTAGEMFVTLFPNPGQSLRQFVTLDPATGEVGLVSARGLESEPTEDIQLLPATNEVAYLTPPSASGQELRVRSLADGGERVLATFLEPGWLVRDVLVSPNGESVALSVQASPGPGAQQQTEVRLLDVGSGAQRVLADRGVAVGAWSPDGRFLLHGGAQPFVLEIATGERWLLTEDANLSVWAQGNASWSADGSFIVIAAPLNEFDSRQWMRLKPGTLSAGPSRR